MVDFVGAARAESDRFAAAAAAVPDVADPAAAMVPSCPEWAVDDLVWHLTEVQHFWASIVSGRLDDPGLVDPLTRADSGELLQQFAEASDRLVTALTEAEPETPCWSWHHAGGNAGWVRRRQAQEALIHRVDAELALAAAGGRGVGPIDADLAADGIDEILTIMLGVDPLPTWATFTPNGPTVGLEPIDGSAGRAWLVQIGRFAGTDPGGTTYDEAALVVLDPATSDGRPISATVRGPAAEIDLWLWRRAPLDQAVVSGELAAAERLSNLAELT